MLEKNSKKKKSDLMSALKPLIILLIFTISFWLVPSYGINEDTKKVKIEFFHIEGCPVCEKKGEIIDKIIRKYNNTVLYEKKSVYEIENFKRIEELNLDPPSLVFNEKDSVNIKDLSEKELENLIAEKVEYYSNENVTVIKKGRKDLTPYLVVSAGFLAGLQPCCLAVVAFLSGLILALVTDRKRIFVILSAFGLGVFSFFFLKGLLILSILDFIPRYSGVAKIIAGLIPIVFGILFIKDYSIKESRLFKTPDNVKNVIHNLASKNTMFSSFSLGLIFSLVKLPCVTGIYLGILNLIWLQHDFASGLSYLLLYNVAKVTPIFFLSLAITMGLNPLTLDEFREKKRPTIKLINGLFMIALGVVIIVGYL